MTQHSKWGFPLCQLMYMLTMVTDGKDMITWLWEKWKRFNDSFLSFIKLLHCYRLRTLGKRKMGWSGPLTFFSLCLCD